MSPSEDLPPIELAPVRSLVGFLAKRFGIPAVLVSGALLSFSRDRAVVFGAVGGPLYLAVLLGVLLPLLLRTQRRARRRRLAEAPPGTLFAAAATAVRGVPGAGLRQGALEVGLEGIRFTPRSTQAAPVVLPWAAVQRLVVGQAPQKPLEARLQAFTKAGEHLVWGFGGGTELREALTRLAAPAATGA